MEKEKMVKRKLLLKLLLFVFIGAIVGYGYYYFIGCRTGACPLTSNPYISTAYGSIFGLIFGFDIRLFSKRS